MDSMRSVVGDDRSRQANRLIRIAGLVDTKISRIAAGGEFKRDSYVDLIAYLSLMCDLHEAYKKPAPVGNTNGAARCVA